MIFVHASSGQRVHVGQPYDDAGIRTIVYVVQDRLWGASALVVQFLVPRQQRGAFGLAEGPPPSEVPVVLGWIPLRLRWTYPGHVGRRVAIVPSLAVTA